MFKIAVLVQLHHEVQCCNSAKNQQLILRKQMRHLIQRHSHSLALEIKEGKIPVLK